LQGIPVEIRFVGMSWGSYGDKFKLFIKQIDPKGEFIFWEGSEKFEKINNYYKSANAFIFASTCENLPNILIEAMASGIPIACSNRQPMTDVLGEYGFYFDSLNPEDIANTIINMIHDKELRTKNSIGAFHLIKDFTWYNCSHQTFSFISSIINKN
jgi:glycosyltransferase involved in cell wall biosynthesis